MKSNNTKITQLVVLLPLVILFVTGSYFFYTTWMKYSSSSELEQHLSKVELLQSLEQSIYEENICTAQMSGDRENLKEVCQTFRNQTNTIVSKLMKQSNHLLLSKKINKILFSKEETDTLKFSLLEKGKLEKILQDIRYNIDTSQKLNLKMLIEGDYHKNILNPIEQYWKDFDSYSTTENKYYFNFLNQINKLYAYSTTETTFGAYFLSNKKIFTSKDLAQWDRYITLSVFPDIEAYSNIDDIKPRLIHLFSEETREEIVNKIDDMRIDILVSHTTGEYESNIEDWVSYNKEKQNLFREAKSIVLNHLSNKVQKIISSEEMILFGSAMISLFGLILFIYTIISSLRKAKADEKALNEMIEEIEILTKESKKEVLDSDNLLKDFSDKKQVYDYIRSILRLLHQKELQAEDANNAKDLFLANMSHEIRTPLNGIVGFTQLLKDSPLTADQEEFINIIENSSDNLLSIVNDILDISKINANKMELEHIPFDLHEKVESAVETFVAKADEKGVELGIMIEPTLSRNFIGDPTKLSQVLINLVSNALKFTPDKGFINLKVEEVESDSNTISIRFSVNDSGIGISKEQKNNIFRSFTQADSSTNRKYGGTGLGLTISQNIVNYMGGTLDVESKVGEGSEFFFTIAIERDFNHAEPVYQNHKNISTALAIPTLNMKERELNLYLKTYIEHLGSTFKFYSFEELLSSEHPVSMPDILFVDHQHIKDETLMNEFLKLDTHLVLKTTGKLKQLLNNKKQKLLTMIHKPMTLSKTDRIMENYTSDNISTSKSNNSQLSHVKFENIHALVAEDNVINQKLLLMTLKNFGLKVTLTSNGKEAFEKRQEGGFDIIFMDIQMPIMSGIESTKAILSYEKKNNIKHIPIVALTANALKGDREKYMEAGMDNYASKPINLLELRNIIARYFPHEEEVKPQEPVEQAVEEETVTILLYNHMKLQSNIYRSIFQTFGFNVDIVRDSKSFMDALKTSSYTYAMYDELICTTIEHTIVDSVKDSGAIPIMFVSEEKDKTYKIKTLKVNATREIIREIFKKKEA